MGKLLGVKKNQTRHPKKVFNVQWSKNIAPSYETGNLPVIFNAPLIKDNVIYIGDNKGFFKALDEKTGREIWSKRERGTYYSTPTIVDGSIIYGTSSGRVFSRNIATGKLNYEVMVGDPVESLGAHKSGRIVFNLRNHQVICLDIATGETLWSFKKSMANLTTIQSSGTPVISGDYVIVGFADGSLSSFRLETGEIRWEVELSTRMSFNDVDTKPIVIKNKIFTYASGEQLLMIDAKSGNILERYDFYPTSELTLIGSSIYFGDRDGRIVELDHTFTARRVTPVGIKGIKYVEPWKNGLAVFSLYGKIHFVEGFFNRSSSLNKTSYRLGSDESLIISRPSILGDSLALSSSLGRLVVFQ